MAFMIISGYTPTKIRLSERFAKETIKREQKKFTFNAESEFLRPLGQILFVFSEREYLRDAVSKYD